MHIVKKLLAVIGACGLVAAVLWFLLGYSSDGAVQGAPPEAITANEVREGRRVTCDAEHVFHLERLQANKSLKVMELGGEGTANVQRYLDLTMQTPIRVNELAGAKVWIAWQYQVVSIGGSLPAQGVIAVVQDGCALYRREGDAEETLAIAKGEWSR